MLYPAELRARVVVNTDWVKVNGRRDIQSIHCVDADFLGTRHCGPVLDMPFVGESDRAVQPDVRVIVTPHSG